MVPGGGPCLKVQNTWGAVVRCWGSRAPGSCIRGGHGCLAGGHALGVLSTWGAVVHWGDKAPGVLHAGVGAAVPGGLGGWKGTASSGTLTPSPESSSTNGAERRRPRRRVFRGWHVIWVDAGTEGTCDVAHRGSATYK